MTTTTTEAIAHPAWCTAGWCTAHREPDHEHYICGEHVQPVAPPLRSGWGASMLVGIVSAGDEPLAGGEQVLLRVAPADVGEHVDWTGADAEQVRLEPEEARLLARRLLAAADE